MSDGDPVLVAVGTTDVRSMREALWPAFRADTGVQATLDYAQDVSTPRVLANLRGSAEGSRPDVVFVSNPAALAGAGLTEATRDADTARFPAGWLDPERRWVPLYIQPVVAIHNAYRGAPPHRWEDLAEPRYSGRICFEEPWRMLTTGPGLAELASTMTETAWDAAVDALAAQEPLIVGDNERSVLEVATGSRWVGLSNWNVARRVRVGSPVRHQFFEPTPCIPGFGVLIRGGRELELGRSFLGWLGSEAGQRAYAGTGRVPALLDLDVPTALYHVLPPGITPLCGTTGWVADPQPWAERLRARFARSSEGVLQGKLA